MLGRVVGGSPLMLANRTGIQKGISVDQRSTVISIGLRDGRVECSSGVCCPISERTALGEDGVRRLEQDQQIKSDGPVLHVPKVEPDAFLPAEQ